LKWIKKKLIRRFELQIYKLYKSAANYNNWNSKEYEINITKDKILLIGVLEIKFYSFLALSK